jgi:NUDIX domain
MQQPDYFTHIARSNRHKARLVVATPLLATAVVLGLYVLHLMATKAALLLCAITAAGSTVTLAAYVARFLPQFATHAAGFALIVKPPLGQTCTDGDRRFLLMTQSGDPHHGMKLFPGGLMRSDDASPWNAARRKVDGVGGLNTVDLATQPRFTFKRVMTTRHKKDVPRHVPYYAYIFEGFISGDDGPGLDGEGVTWCTAHEIAQSSNVPLLIRELVARVTEEYDR